MHAVRSTQHARTWCQPSLTYGGVSTGPDTSAVTYSDTHPDSFIISVRIDTLMSAFVCRPQSHGTAAWIQRVRAADQSIGQQDNPTCNMRYCEGFIPTFSSESRGYLCISWSTIREKINSICHSVRLQPSMYDE